MVPKSHRPLSDLTGLLSDMGVHKLLIGLSESVINTGLGDGHLDTTHGVVLCCHNLGFHIIQNENRSLGGLTVLLKLLGTRGLDIHLPEFPRE